MNRRSLIILLAIVFIVVLIIVAFVYFKNKSTTQVIPTTTTTQSQTQHGGLISAFSGIFEGLNFSFLGGQGQEETPTYAGEPYDFDNFGNIGRVGNFN